MPRLTRLTVRVRLSTGWIANIQMGKPGVGQYRYYMHLLSVRESVTGPSYVYGLFGEVHGYMYRHT